MSAFIKAALFVKSWEVYKPPPPSPRGSVSFAASCSRPLVTRAILIAKRRARHPLRSTQGVARCFLPQQLLSTCVLYREFIREKRNPRCTRDQHAESALALCHARVNVGLVLDNSVGGRQSMRASAHVLSSSCFVR